MAGRASDATRRTALGGVLAAGSLAVMWLASVVPSGSLGLTAAAGLFPVGAVIAAGRPAGLLCWAAASVLGLLLLPNKGVALIYLCFLGLYPAVKSRMENVKSRVLEWVGKFAFFNVALSICWFVFRSLFLPALPQWLGEKTWLVYAAGNVVFLIYDIALTRLIGAVMVRLRPLKGR